MMMDGTVRLRLQCFGTPQIALCAAPVTGLSNKALALFVYLAVTGRPQHRDHLADLLWSECNNQQARNNLRYLLPEVRKPLGDYLMITPQTITFDRSRPYGLDTEDFAHTLTRAPETVTTSTLQAALDRYQAEFLAGFRVRNAPVFEQWLTTQQETYHRLAVQGFQQLMERYDQEGDYRAGLVAGQRLLMLEPWHEAGHRRQITLLARDGQRGAALNQYQQLVQILADELAVEPEPVTTALYEAIRRGDYDKKTRDRRHETGDGATSDRVTTSHPITLSPPHPVIPSPLHNLPSQLTPFFGREQEIAELYAQLHREECRLITLIGEGGVGKTRLALAVAQALLDLRFWMLDFGPVQDEKPKAKACPDRIQNPKFPDGIWFVSLAGLTAGLNLAEQIAAAIAQAMNVTFSDAGVLTSTLLAYLRNKRALLILDNVEQILDGVDFMVELLRQTAGITLLVTSRALLNLQAEYEWPVTGLPTPSCDQARSSVTADLLRYSSVALFVERAQRVQRNFQLDHTNQSTISAICRQLHGLPLGIELAAAQLRCHSCDEIQQLLTVNALTVTTAYRDVPLRHRSLTAVLEDSWRLLTAVEQQTLAHLSIFQESFTAAAAVAIVETTPTILTALCDQSLLHCTTPQRYLLHETVRQFAAAKLKQVDRAERAATAARHGQYYLALLCDQGRVLQGPTPQAAMTVLQQEICSIEQAWRWAITQAAADLLMQSALALCEFYHCAYRLEQGKALLGAAVAMIQQQVEATPAATGLQSALATLLCAQGHLLIVQEAYAASLHAAQQAVALAEAGGQPALVARGHYLWGASLLNSGRYEAGSEQLAAALAVARTTVPQAMVREVVILTLNKLAMLAEQRADYPAALAYCQEALALSRTAQAVVAENRTQLILGSIYQRMGDFQNAKACWEGALALMKQSGIQANQPDLLTNLGVLCDNQGNYAAAQRYYTAALRAYRNLGDQQHQAEVLGNLGISADYVGDYTAALAYSQECYELLQQLGLTGRLPIVLVNLGLHTHHVGDQQAAQRYGHQALISSQQLNNQHWQSYAWTVIGHAALALGEFAEAQAAYETAVTLARAVAVPFMTIEPLAGLVRVALARQPACQCFVQPLETILAFLAQTAGEGLEEPLRVYLTCYLGLHALWDPRAETVLAQAYELLQKRAEQIDDPVLRRSFLENVAVHRTLCSAAQAAKYDEPTFASNPSGVANHHTGGPTADRSADGEGVGSLCLPGRQPAAAYARPSGRSALE
jgi:predicted ATPase/DNA-binding SARP family transcriptional activator/predicted negative regulator of RcsB-dependent stress response